jgi:hypothetical protein
VLPPAPIDPDTIAAPTKGGNSLRNAIHAFHTQGLASLQAQSRRPKHGARRRTRTACGDGLLRFVEGWPVSHVTTAFLTWLGQRLAAPLALEGAVAAQREDTIRGGRQGLQNLGGEPPEQRLRAPIGGTQQAPVVLVSQMCRAMPSQRFENRVLPIDEVQDQELAEDQLVPAVATGL